MEVRDRSSFSGEVKRSSEKGRSIMQRTRPKALCWAVAIFLITVPLQLLVQWEVVTGLPPGGAHTHAHEHGVGDHVHGHGCCEDEGHDEEALRGNLIPNYGFEVGSKEQAWGWHVKVRGSSEVYRDEQVRRRGTASGAVVGQALSSGPSGWAFYPDRFPRGEDVSLTGHLLAEVERGGAYLSLRAFRRGEEGVNRPLMEVSRVKDVSVSQWEEVSLKAHVPPEAEILEVEVGFFGKGRAWFDDLNLEVSDAPELNPGKNLLSNPSFREGLGDWLTFGDRGEGDDLKMKGPKSPARMVLTSDGGEPWGVCQGLTGFPSGGTLRVDGKLGSRLEEGRAYLDLFLFLPEGVRRVRVAELAGVVPVREFRAEVSWEGDLPGAWLGVVVDGKGSVEVWEAGLWIVSGH